MPCRGIIPLLAKRANAAAKRFGIASLDHVKDLFETRAELALIDWHVGDKVAVIPPLSIFGLPGGFFQALRDQAEVKIVEDRAVIK